MARFVISVTLLFLCFGGGLSRVRADEPAKAKLTKADEKLLKKALKEFVFDPKGATRVRVRVPDPDRFYNSQEKVERDGWLVKQPRLRVYFVDSEYEDITKKDIVKKLDFVKECHKRYSHKVAEKADFSYAMDPESDLVRAAWLYRLGKNKLAAQALERARTLRRRNREKDEKLSLDQQLLQVQRESLALYGHLKVRAAYLHYADNVALRDSKRLLRLYPKESKEYTIVGLLLRELKTREDRGTFNEQPQPYPRNFVKWSTNQKLGFIVPNLEQIRGDFVSFARLTNQQDVKALVAIGEAAIPALIDVMETDQRRTRIIVCPDSRRSPKLLPVREVAFVAIKMILRTEDLAPTAPRRDWSAFSEKEARTTVKALRKYWKKYGKYPPRKRMMVLLTDPKVNFKTKRRAAHNLTTDIDSYNIDGQLTNQSNRYEKPPQRPHPVAKQFQNPTPAEALLLAMDQDLAAFKRNPKTNSNYDIEQIEDAYLISLLRLGDKRIASECARRAKQAKHIRGRRQWSWVAYRFGDSTQFKEYANEFAKGKIFVPRKGKEDTRFEELGELLSVLKQFQDANLPEIDRALWSLADLKHPFYGTIQVMVAVGARSDTFEIFTHPFALAILARELSNTKRNRVHTHAEGQHVYRDKQGSIARLQLPSYLSDPDKVRKGKVAERHCDSAGSRLSAEIVGAPKYHTLMKDREKQLPKLRKFMAKFGKRFVRLSKRELRHMGFDANLVRYRPKLGNRKLPATAKDVKSGKAIFHFDGKGKVMNYKLPALGFIQEVPNGPVTKVLVLQAEEDLKGSPTLGVLRKDGFRVVPGLKVTVVD